MDPDSIIGRRWDTAKMVISEIASIAAKYDSDGVEVQFFNHIPEPHECARFKNLKSAEDVTSLFKGFENHMVQHSLTAGLMIS